jgi:hypothetical protein
MAWDWVNTQQPRMHINFGFPYGKAFLLRHMLYTVRPHTTNPHRKFSTRFKLVYGRGTKRCALVRLGKLSNLSYPKSNLTLSYPMSDRPTLWFSCSRHFSWSLTLSNPIALPPTYSPTLIYFGRERGWWITCNYPTVLREKKRNIKGITCAICWLNFVLHEENHNVGLSDIMIFPVPDAFPHVVRTLVNR